MKAHSLLYILHTNATIDTFLRRTFVLQPIVQPLQSDLIHSAAVVLNMKQQHLLSNLATDA
ncbi:hypothetical protein D3C78_1808770 [compost metagenome]